MRTLTRTSQDLNSGRLRDKIRTIFWDVDGTLFHKVDAIKQEHKLLLYNAFVICRTAGMDRNPFRIRENMVFRSLAEVPDQIKREYDALLRDVKKNPNGKYGSNGHLFIGEFGLDQTYVAKVISTIDYGKFLTRDESLIQMFEFFKRCCPHIQHGIMSNEVYETVAAILMALGCDISFFKNPRVDELFPPEKQLMGETKFDGPLGLLCAYNLHGKKPNQKPFIQMLQVAGLESSPKSMLYVGDSIDKDIIPAKQAGMVSALVWANEHCEHASFTFRTVYDIASLFE